MGLKLKFVQIRIERRSPAVAGDYRWGLRARVTRMEYWMPLGGHNWSNGLGKFLWGQQKTAYARHFLPCDCTKLLRRRHRQVLQLLKRLQDSSVDATSVFRRCFLLLRCVVNERVRARRVLRGLRPSPEHLVSCIMQVAYAYAVRGSITYGHSLPM
jgi:hypothetical protein